MMSACPSIGARTCAFVVTLLISLNTWSHESITTEARKGYLSTLLDARQTLASQAAPAAKAKALFQIGSTLDEIRDLFNQDIISHGAVKGLESTLLLNELERNGFKMEMSPKIGLYLSQLNNYRSALKLDSKAAFKDRAKYLLLKNQFYDSFTDNPLTPLSQTREELSELLAIGESLLDAKEPVANPEEVRFILAIHYLQAVQQQLISKEDGHRKFKKLQAELRKDYPQSLKPLTLEALAPSLP
jgi:hypothetical protein